MTENPGDQPLRRTPLFETHVSLGGRMVPFGGWEMPVQYPAGVLAEHHAVRNGVGLFDIGHMGQVEVSGAGSLEYLQWLTPGDVSRLEDGQAQYSFLCADDGGVIDDIIIYRIGPDQFLVIVNASNTDVDFAWMRAHLVDGGRGVSQYLVNLTLLRPDRTLLALQGPRSLETLQRCSDTDLSGLGYYRVMSAMVAGVDALVARTGYTGERGYEIAFDECHAGAVWNTLLEAGAEFGIVPCGLGARDTLRLEASMPLYGHELARSVNPYEAGLSRVIRFEKGPFVGAKALQAVQSSGRVRALIGLELTVPGIARMGHQILLPSGEVIGEATSGGPSPTLRKSIAMGFVPVAQAIEGAHLCVEVRGRRLDARVVAMPFYKRAPAKRREASPPG
ncbi:MAG: glycine cleavage system aminomethyltransferase GcvT [Chloroflexi bacterium]|nr:glycine cleavage system aminomethyltransferase GcvT [Chloroflexota bacterium]